MPRFDKIAFVTSETKKAEEALAKLTKRYGNAAFTEADAIVALGGDGLMLQTMHGHLNSRIPIYGMNRGSVGFLLNDYHEDSLKERLKAAEITVIHPLRMTAYDEHGVKHEALAIRGSRVRGGGGQNVTQRDRIRPLLERGAGQEQPALAIVSGVDPRLPIE